MLKKYYRLIATILIVATFITLNLLRLDSEAHTVVIIFGAIISALILIDIVKSIRNKHYGVDILALTAIISTILVGEYLASLIIILMLTGGEALENYANTRAKRELTRLISRAPSIAHVTNDANQITDTPVNQVKIGTPILIKTGEIVPLDGELLSKSATLDTSSITGEALPFSYKQGDQILSGSINTDQPLTIRATAEYQNSQYNQIVEMVRAIEKQPATFVRLADRYAIPFTIIAYLIAGLAWWLSADFTRFAEVLVVASPCPLILAAPIAFISGMSRASSIGVIIKSGSSIEKLARAQSIAFDKTGTLSKGDVIVESVNSLHPKYTARKILQIIASAEQSSSHILARSILDHAKSQNLKLIHYSHITEEAGLGLNTTKDNQKIIIGNADHLAEHHISMKSSDPRSSIFLAINRELVGQITFRDHLRPEAKSVITKIRKLGIKHTVMITGDAEQSAQTTAAALNIPEYHAECLPADKVNIVKKLPKPTIFVGDGINDAPVLAAADVSMALAAFGSTAASDAASVVIMADNLRKVPDTIHIARRTMTVARQSVLGGIILCIALMLIASTGVIPVILGALLQESLDVLSILNSLRARH